jgi:hypothetical protein
MYNARLQAAEEIQMLLPDHQPGRDLPVNAVTLVGIGLLLIAIPACCFRFLSARTPA